MAKCSFRKRKRKLVVLAVSMVVLTGVLLYFFKEQGEVLNSQASERIEETGVSQAGNPFYNNKTKEIYDYIASLPSLEKNTVEMSRDNTGYAIRYMGDEEFKVLQVTDIHISGLENNYSKNISAMKTVYEMVVRERPDFIVMTGDFVFGMADTNNADDRTALDMALRFMQAVGVPWTWTFGNHDHDYFDRLETKTLAEILSTCSNLYLPEKNSEIKGYTNAVFPVYWGGQLISALVLLDSNGEIWDKDGNVVTYDYIDDSQILWYDNKIQELNIQAGRTLETFLYIHIPLEEYAQANDYISGQKREEVCSSKIHNALFETIKELGSTRAVFCGHDHLNDFIALYDGIYLVYSKSIDYTAYKEIANLTEQRGACMLTLQENGTFIIENIKYE